MLGHSSRPRPERGMVRQDQGSARAAGAERRVASNGRPLHSLPKSLDRASIPYISKRSYANNWAILRRVFVSLVAVATFGDARWDPFATATLEPIAGCVHRQCPRVDCLVPVKTVPSEVCPDAAVGGCRVTKRHRKFASEVVDVQGESCESLERAYRGRQRA